MSSFYSDTVIVGIVIFFLVTFQFFMQIAWFYWFRSITGTGVPPSRVADGAIESGKSSDSIAQLMVRHETSPINSRAHSPVSPSAWINRAKDLNSPYFPRSGGSGGGGRVFDSFLSVPRSPALPVGDTSIMTATYLQNQKNSEKSSKGFVALASIDSTDIVGFISRYSLDECSIVEPIGHISRDIRPSLLRELRKHRLIHEDDDLADIMKDGLLTLLRTLIIQRNDISALEVIQSFNLKPSDTISRTSMAKFIETARGVFHENAFFQDIPQRTIKNALRDGLNCTELKNDLNLPLQRDRWARDDFTYMQFLDLIDERVDKISAFKKECSLFGKKISPVVDPTASAAIVEPLAKNKKSGLIPLDLT